MVTHILMALVLPGAGDLVGAIARVFMGHGITRGGVRGRTTGRIGRTGMADLSWPIASTHTTTGVMASFNRS